MVESALFPLLFRTVSPVHHLVLSLVILALALHLTPSFLLRVHFAVAGSSSFSFLHWRLLLHFSLLFLLPRFSFSLLSARSAFLSLLPKPSFSPSFQATFPHHHRPLSHARAAARGMHAHIDVLTFHGDLMLLSGVALHLLPPTYLSAPAVTVIRLFYRLTGLHTFMFESAIMYGHNICCSIPVLFFISAPSDVEFTLSLSSAPF
mmetsp:Transcript_8972/g.19455  ORF Transcript_8972/g.19455 Transcript_8972/m.19455 type:complete len:205 (-) Transcript_8972:506-1120(-)